jgi:hypothetical protein
MPTGKVGRGKAEERGRRNCLICGNWKQIIIKLKNGLSVLTSPSRKRPLLRPNNRWKVEIEVCYKYVVRNVV